MKKNYTAPNVSVEIFTPEEILTDIISASQPTTVTGGTWSDFIGGSDA